MDELRSAALAASESVQKLLVVDLKQTILERLCGVRHYRLVLLAGGRIFHLRGLLILGFLLYRPFGIIGDFHRVLSADGNVKN